MRPDLRRHPPEYQTTSANTHRVLEARILSFCVFADHGNVNTFVAGWPLTIHVANNRGGGIDVQILSQEDVKEMRPNLEIGV